MKPLSHVFAHRRTVTNRALGRGIAALFGLAGLMGLSRVAHGQIVAEPITPPAEGVNVLTHHNNNARTGVNPFETLLTPARLQTGYTPTGGTRQVFGKMFERRIDGEVYAQPLYVSNLAITDRETGRVALRNVVYVVTTTGTIYAYDADSNAGKYIRPFWIVNFEYSAVDITATDAADVYTDYLDFGAKLGIIGTPVIDPVRQALYVVVRTREGLSYRQRLYAFDLSTGNQRPNSPQLITGSVRGTGDGSDFIDGNSVLLFDSIASLQQNQQAALLLQDNKVFVAWGSHADIAPYHGWVQAFDAGTLQSVGAFVTTPNASSSIGDPGALAVGGGISQSGAGIAGDGSGNIYVVAGNGTYNQDINANGDDLNTPGDGLNIDGFDYGQSVLKLRVAPSGALSVADYFTPFNQDELTNTGTDLTTGGIVLLPPSVGRAANPELLVAGGLEGRIYLLDRTAQSTGQVTRMGRYRDGADTQIVQSFRNAIGSLFGTPAYFNGKLYYSASGDSLKAFPIANGQITTSPIQSSRVQLEYPGATPSISANGTSSGIVWTIGANYPAVIPGDTPPGPSAYLLAHDAADVTRTVFSSLALGATNSAGPYTNFSVPTIANGKVYVAGKGRLTTYGFARPREARASRFQITGPTLRSPIFSTPILSVRAGYSFAITAIGADNNPLRINGTVQLAFRIGGYVLQAGGSITFANQSQVVINRAFINPGFYEMIVTDRNGTSSSTFIFVKGNTDEGTDRFVVTAKSTAVVGEVVSLTVRSVSAGGTPTVMYDIQTTPAPPSFVPHPFYVYGTRPGGTYDTGSGFPLYRALPSPSPAPQLFFESVKTVQIRMNDVGEQVIIVTDGINTGTIKITVR